MVVQISSAIIRSYLWLKSVTPLQMESVCTIIAKRAA